MVFRFLGLGQSMPMEQLMANLITLYPNDTYASQKAAGAIGGACRHGRIMPIKANNGRLVYVRVM